MTDLQRIEFEMLKEFVRICDELKLKYFLVCGSALGAVKYKGFIPWDDDMDVALPRADYEIFCQKAQSMLPEHLFLQNSDTDKYYPLIFSKIRHIGTTFIEKPYAKTNMNHGIYIDVFPLDGYPDDVRAQQKIEKEKQRYNLMRLCCLDVPHTWKTRLLVTGQRFLGIHKKPFRFVKRLEKNIVIYPTENSNIWCNHGNWQGKLEYASRTQYGDGTWAEFEGLLVRIPEKYDEYLMQKYGDWHSDPLDEDKIGHHYYYVCDTKKTYKYYVEELSKEKIRLKTNF